MALSNDELMLQAEALGYSTAIDEQDGSIIFLEGEPRWKLQLQPTITTATVSDRWLLMVDGSPQISFYPEDALRFLLSQHRSSR